MRASGFEVSSVRAGGSKPPSRTERNPLVLMPSNRQRVLNETSLPLYMGERPRTHEDKSGFVQYAPAVLRNTRPEGASLVCEEALTALRSVRLTWLVYSRFGPLFAARTCYKTRNTLSGPRYFM